MKIGIRLKHAWNAFSNKDPTDEGLRYVPTGISSSISPTLPVFYSSKASAASIFNRVAIDVSSIKFVHAKIDDNNRFLEAIPSSLNECLNVEANIDQTGRAFIQDIAMSMLDEGVVAVLPIHTDLDPLKTSSYDIKSLRVGKITQWWPNDIEVDAYDERYGVHSTIVVPKKIAAIIENPLYNIINDATGKLNRILSRLGALDLINNKTISDKLNLIVQLPYAIQSQKQQDLAAARKEAITDQLTNDRYGIAYIGSTEKIIQLNRTIDNNILSEITELRNEMYAQLGWTEAVFNGTADERQMLNYHNRTIDPICAAISDEMKRKFLTKTARTQHQSIIHYRDPLSLITVNEVADIADKLTRNEILTSNEVRSLLGFRPVADPRADELRNKNLNSSNDQLPVKVTSESIEDSRDHPED